MRRLLAWLGATPAELTALAVLLAGAASVTALIWVGSVPRPAGPEPAPVPVAVASVGRPVTVHVAGAVHRPGLVELPAGARVADAIAAAGGPRGDAVLDALNLARAVEDGEQVVVPVAGAAGSEAPVAGGTRADGRIDVNRATAAELEELPGIGPVLAERIVAHRDEHGPFADLEELLEVRGIGERLLEQLAELAAT